MNREGIYKKFKSKLLGSGNNSDKPNYYVDDFVNEDVLVDFIIGTHDHENAFTKDDFSFIEEYHGLSRVIEMVISKYPEYPFEDGLSPEDALAEKKEFAIES